MKTQNEEIFEALCSGRRITSLDAVKMGIFRLSARIYDLKKLGHTIADRSICVKTRRGVKYVKQYWLDVK